MWGGKSRLPAKSGGADGGHHTKRPVAVKQVPHINDNLGLYNSIAAVALIFDLLDHTTPVCAIHTESAVPYRAIDIE